MHAVPIRTILADIRSGQIRIPAFQRGFVWDAERVAFFMDSLFKGYPFGTLLFWRTHADLKHETSLGPFQLPERDPDRPIDYVLDGQQRLTSVFGVFQSEIQPDPQAEWCDVYFDYTAAVDAQENQFRALTADEVDSDRYFPLNCIFDPIAYRRQTESLSDALTIRMDNLQATFKELQIPIQLFRTDDRASVAIVFERVNRMGVPLDTLQLLSAWTWSEEFDLASAFDDIKEDLAQYGFSEVGEDADLLLKCCAAVLSGDASPSAVVGLNGNEVRENFEQVVAGIQGAVDFLKASLHVEKLDNLPYRLMLIPLVVLFSGDPSRQIQLTQEQAQTVTQWFWRVAFARRYSSGVYRNIQSDIQEMLVLKDGQENRLLFDCPPIDANYFLVNQFRIDAIHSKTLILVLAAQQPLNFVSGQPIQLGDVLRSANRAEFHHIFPRAVLKAAGFPPILINMLANICFLSRADNTTLGGVAPSEYRARMAQPDNDILAHALCPTSLFSNRYPEFVNERASLLAHTANQLMGVGAE